MTNKNHGVSSSETRKKDHLDLALKSCTNLMQMDQRFYYEPALGIHPLPHQKSSVKFLEHDFDFPFWVSSMTGGTEHAAVINERLAQLCAEFNLGMGLGSIRPLLESDSRLKDFNFRSTIGERPFYANLGVAQIDELIQKKELARLEDVLESLQVNGIFIHINPLQEWFQPSGDRYAMSALDVIAEYTALSKTKVIVKEVGQGMGPGSLRALLSLEIQGIEFGAFGGTNFSLLEQKRNEGEQLNPLTFVGHSAEEMVGFINKLETKKEFIISGGIQNAVDGYYLKQKLNSNSVIGLASAWLNPARESYESLREFFINLAQQYQMCEAFLKLKKEGE